MLAHNLSNTFITAILFLRKSEFRNFKMSVNVCTFDSIKLTHDLVNHVSQYLTTKLDRDFQKMVDDKLKSEIVASI